MESLNETMRTTIEESIDSLSIRPTKDLYTDYYSDYDPMVGIRIAISLGVLITLFTFFIFYKTKCNARRTKRMFQASLKTRDYGLDNLEFRTRTFSNDT